MKSSSELIKICMADFENACKYAGLKEINWLPFKQSWFKAYQIGVDDSSRAKQMQIEDILEAVQDAVNTETNEIDMSVLENILYCERPNKV